MDKINKSGIAMSTLIIIMLLIAGFIIIFSLYNEVRAGSAEFTHVQACRNSIIAISSASEITSENINLRINCPAPHTDYSLDSFQYPSAIASELSECWEKTAGEKNRLGTKYSLFFDVFDQDEDVCVVCSTFTVNQQVQTSDIKQYLDSKDLKVTSWDYNHLFPMPRKGVQCPSFIGDYEPGNRPAYLPCWSAVFENLGTRPVFSEYSYLVPEKKYYVMSINAAFSRTQDFNMIAVYQEQDLDNIKCDGDIIFYQKI